MNFLHEQGLKVTLNLHPALGIRSFENCYDAAARAMGLDPAEKKPIEFDITDTQFINTYLIRHTIRMRMRESIFGG